VLYAPELLCRRSRAAPVHPRYLSHILQFTPDVARMRAFCDRVLGLRLSDRSGEHIAFLHTPHGSDHHLVAFAQSHAPGLHHSSWDVGSVDEVGRGMEQMRTAGWAAGWGVGRHVLGSNFFHYVEDPWGSYCEYSAGIDYVPAGLDWPAADHPPEDSLYVWGPALPPQFITNHEQPAP
jgi:catechol 2,3-dioxygenase-like lactoylglutathione lyase family enzyme